MTPIPGDLHDAVSNVAYFIQLSVAPVFLLTGMGAMLGVLTSRLSRIIDRARILEEQYAAASVDGRRAALHATLRVLSQRARLVSWSISLCTTCALFVSTIIVLLFLEALMSTYFRGVVPVLFIIGMLAFIMGLLIFLREIYLATASLRIGPPEGEG
ncbi:MAG: DUF2721 domain-containing protein [Moraxellaceae bacterium]|jgi:hypothetical protein|nr:DUF2721 domain-containing protein [Moraxellaceae bacterium]MBP7229266.1 DUF2721 domain-containing protein [Moraxellaceae bacterium]MBP9045367.1 DUF2721 domain-containing protein [Moraxellaceae bacterium]MBP9731010.1 DUF2721 domain-containing protein [Moraxellaceae bacterium]HQV41639.1 DUF2721 domain-containing protein [Moraxellaceae bacterium]